MNNIRAVMLPNYTLNNLEDRHVCGRWCDLIIVVVDNTTLVPIDRNSIRFLNYSNEQIMSVALDNTRKLFKENIIFEKSEEGIYIGSGVEFGAIAVMFKEEMRSLLSEFDTDMILVPVSVHEFLMLKDDPKLDKDYIRSLLYTVNRDTCMVNYLSDNLYIIDMKLKTVHTMFFGEGVII